LAAVQGAWPLAAGEAVSREAEPVAERDGVVTIACRTAVWAQELDLLQIELLQRVNEALSGPDSDGTRSPVERLRFTASGAGRF
jgi:predicted nucleic acid-binding Zn ribbon protein